MLPLWERVNVGCGENQSRTGAESGQVGGGRPVGQLAPEFRPGDASDADHQGFSHGRFRAGQQGESDVVADAKSAKGFAQLDVFDAEAATPVLDVLDLQRVV